MNSHFTNEKHYYTLNNYCLERFHQKTFRISLNGNFTCPNRDGKISKLGCIFCSEKGSGDFAGEKEKSIPDQFFTIKEKMLSKWPNGFYIAYFQANTNTYGTIEKLKNTYEQIFTTNGLIDEKIKVLSIATRPDCLDNEIINYLASLNKRIEVWIELGFQTSNENTAKFINRGYYNEVITEAVKKLKKANLKVIIHIINGLPYETESDMLATAKFVNNLSPDGIKIHMLHIMKNTPLEKIYAKENFPLLTLEEYVKIIVMQLRILDPSIVIHRLTGDSPKDLLIAPGWTLKKFVVLNEIDKYMRKNNYFQGDLCIK